MSQPSTPPGHANPVPPRPKPWTQRRKGVLVAALVAAVVLAAGAVTFALTRHQAGPVPTPSPTMSLPPGTVRITSPTDGAVVNRCEHISGVANLEPGKTILFATNRTNPPASMWYITHVGNYGNGFVPDTWTGSVYFGSTVRQSYDLFILVMDVAVARTFWDAHKSRDGSYAAVPALPPEGRVADHVRVRQGTTDDLC